MERTQTLTAKELSESCRISLRKAQRVLSEEVKAGRMVMISHARGGQSAVFAPAINSPQVQTGNAPPAQGDLSRLFGGSPDTLDLGDLWKNFKENVPPLTPVAKGGDKRPEAAAVALLSDIHYGMAFTDSQTSGANSYNVIKAGHYVTKYFRNMLSLVEKERSSANVTRLILWLGGDLISGRIHDDIAESNQVGVVTQAVEVEALIASGIEYLLKHGGFHEIYVVCSPGNHARITKERRIHTSSEVSIEEIIYAHLAHRFAPDGVKFVRSQGEITTLSILDSKVRFLHGDSKAISFRGGLGGVLGPLMKAVGKWDQIVAVDYTVIGHYHSLHFGPRACINGSFVGYDPYGLSLAVEVEPPQQGMFLLVEGERRPCCFNRIFLTGPRS